MDDARDDPRAAIPADNPGDDGDSGFVVVNGHAVRAVAGQSLQGFVAAAGYVLDQVAIELNGEIVPKTAYAQRLLRTGDRLEIVQFMGGG